MKSKRRRARNVQYRRPRNVGELREMSDRALVNVFFTEKGSRAPAFRVIEERMLRDGFTDFWRWVRSRPDDVVRRIQAEAVALISKPRVGSLTSEQWGQVRDDLRYLYERPGANIAWVSTKKWVGHNGAPVGKDAERIIRLIRVRYSKGEFGDFRFQVPIDALLAALTTQAEKVEQDD